MKNINITSELVSMKSERNRPVVTCENVIHIEAQGGISSILDMSSWGMNELVDYLIQKEFMDDFTDELIKSGQGSQFFNMVSSKMSKDAA
ncbi:hypothetical protein EX217_01000 [Providencia rettgeri]|uniref:hypothetical protein n=1 Tax=Providencia rettgeri TaxID=587 RepID=UPI001C82A00C|nr:hypothetical protein [Providencia rettgeri]MBX6968875.1 hypothetical protein [Providencia rettgeri]MBX6977541.1 hypothetical protein [Providencia rettgeri]MBX6994609.1 hypothetical protein [Providencia rettgeri]MBX6999106.1 hypothetical protein [Providencia rettgeri]MBX7020004.1 hypothetical protein [Providencia rettgeri]